MPREPLVPCTTVIVVTEASNEGKDSSEIPPPAPGSQQLLADPPQAQDRVGASAVVEKPVPKDPTPFDPRWIVAVVAAGVLADLALRRIPWNNVAMAALIIITAGGLLVSGFIKTRSTKVMMVVAMVFGAFLAWRAGGLLSTFNFLTAAGLITAGATFGRRGDIWNVGPLRLASSGLGAIEQSLITPVAGVQEAGARYRQWSESGNEGARALVRGAALAAPVVIVLGVLLASADVVFESFFTGFDLRLDTIAGHLILAAIGGVTMAALLRLAGRRSELDLGEPTWRLGHIEGIVILGSITALFAAFTLAQLLTVLGGADDALQRAGLEPKQFARQGFFQLLWVAAITLAVVMTIRVLTSKADKGQTVIKVLGLVTVLLTMVIVAVALVRIFFYIDDGGLTPRRLYAMVISVWIAACFALLAARLAGFKSEKAWLTPAAGLAAIIILGGLNLANPQRRIAEDNLDRDQSNLVWHIRQGQFVGDGRAVLAGNLDQLSPDLAQQAEEELCAQYRSQAVDAQDDDWLSFNFGRSKADDAIVNLCDA